MPFDLHELLSPITSSALEWLTVAALVFVAGYLKRLISEIKAMEKSTKALMRGNLTQRYKQFKCEGNWISEDHRREWLDDWETYHELNGTNGYLDTVREHIKSMPGNPSDLKTDRKEEQ